MLDTLKTGTADEIIEALKGADALSDDEIVELCAVWKTHEAAGVKKLAKKVLEKLAPAPCDALKSVIKASLGNDNNKIAKKLNALEAAGGFPDVSKLAEALARRTEEHLGLAYLCEHGGPLARTALQRAVNDKGHLDLSHITHFPVELGEVEGVVSLELRGCKLTALPAPVRALTDLKSIDLSHNKFKKLPEDIRELSRLESITLHDTPLSQGLGEGIYDLPNLKRLWIIRAKMKAIPEDIGRLKSLEHLEYVQCQKVKHIPDSVAELKNLKTLEVDWCALDAVNPVVWTMDWLEHIDLSQSPLEQIPTEIGGFKKLRKLRLLCPLQAIPEELCACTDLEDFDVRGSFTRLPANIGALQNLKRFSVSFCGFLEAIPESFWSIPRLEYVDFKYTRVPDDEYARARTTWPDAYVCS